MLPEDQKPQDPAEVGTAAVENGPLPGPPTALTCPDCGGTLWELASGNMVRYRCHVGHAYTADSMVGAQAVVVEEALWTAVRSLEEKAELSRRLAERSRKRNLHRLAQRYEDAVKKAERGSDTIRQLLLTGTAESPETDIEKAEEQESWQASALESERA